MIPVGSHVERAIDGSLTVIIKKLTLTTTGNYLLKESVLVNS